MCFPHQLFSSLKNPRFLTGSEISDIPPSNIFLTYLLEQGKQKEKNKQMELHQTKKFCPAKEINKIKRQLTEWENIFANDISDKGLISNTTCCGQCG